MRENRFVVCLNNDGYAASLEVRKLYECREDLEASEMGQIRVVDESGEDYLYPANRFLPVELSQEVADAVAQVA